MQNYKKINSLEFLRGINKIFFVGIGGIGVSSLAKLFFARGYKIEGSDKYVSEVTDNLEKQGIKIYIGHKKKNLDSDTDLLIYSPAVPVDTLERKRATKLGIKQLSYPEVLGLISNEKYTIAISGTHGKSTTTAMLGLILDNAGLNPTVIVGSKIKYPGWNENIKIGKEKYFVVEACEWRAHMLKLKPKIIILTNLEPDHLDYYKTFKNLKDTFKKYVKRLPQNGLLVYNADDKDCAEVAKFAQCKTRGYSIKSGLGFSLKIPGQFNIYNALAASTCASALRVKKGIIKKTLTNFKGIWRRFEIIKEDKHGYTRLPAGRQKFIPKITLVSDYGHHPTAIKKTLEAAKKRYPNRRLVIVFQPHHFERTRRLFKEFIGAFDLADFIILNEVYDVPGRPVHRQGREAAKKIGSSNLVKELKNRGLSAVFTKNLKETKRAIIKNIKQNDVVLIMGAGDIYKLSTELIDDQR